MKGNIKETRDLEEDQYNLNLLSESSISSEDENGELLNKNISHKFLDTFTRIRDNDFKLIDQKDYIFNDEDFAHITHENMERATPTEKPIYYKDLVREEILSKGERIDNERVSPHKQEAFVTEQMNLKNEFLAASKNLFGADMGQEDNEEDRNFLKMKTKTQEEINLENLEFNEFLKLESKKGSKEGVADLSLLRRFWGDDSTIPLSKDDKFLRHYILTEGWKGGSGQNRHKKLEKEDDERDSEFDEYESNNNFRYEDGSGGFLQNEKKVITGGRNLQNTMRSTQGTKTESRKLRRERKKLEKEIKLREINDLKDKHKLQLKEKIRKIKEKGGVGMDLKNLEIELEKNFNPGEFDNAMELAFDQKYYEDEVEEAEGEMQNSGTSEEENSEEEIYRSEDEEPLEWWLCDQCQKALAPGSLHMDCKICSNYTLCIKCFKKSGHPHNMMKNKIAKNSRGPPKDYKKEMKHSKLICSECEKQLDKRIYGCEECLYYICNSCYKSNEHEHTLIKVKREKEEFGDLEELNQEDLLVDKLIDKYYTTNYQDIIAGEIPTRFKYEEVEPIDFGITNGEILLLDDKELNSLISLKKIAAYRTDIGSMSQIKKNVTYKKRKYDKLMRERKKELKSALMGEEEPTMNTQKRHKKRDIPEGGRRRIEIDTDLGGGKSIKKKRLETYDL